MPKPPADMFDPSLPVEGLLLSVFLVASAVGILLNGADSLRALRRR